MGTHRFALVVILLAACGDDSGSAAIDAAVGTDDTSPPMIDAAVLPGTCEYTEAADATNELRTAAEPTGLTLGASKQTICGTINNTHYDSPSEVVDGDFYSFTVTADVDVIVHLTGIDLGTPEQTVMQLSKSTAIYSFGVVQLDHATTAAHLTPGTYTIAVGALNPASLSAALTYRIAISIDTPATRCPANTGTVTHAEGTDNGTNDVVGYDSNGQSQLTAATTDAPEVSGINAAPATSYLVTGTAANVNPADEYMDRDTFSFTTGPTTNQVSVRLNWPDTADLDFRIYPAAPLGIAGGLRASTTEDEFQTFAVKPSSTYWLSVAESDGSAAPATYAATLCGETFTP